MKSVQFSLLVFVLFACRVFAHGGRTDSSGGHVDRSTGLYHSHSGGSGGGGSYFGGFSNGAAEAEAARRANLQYNANLSRLRGARMNARASARSAARKLPAYTQQDANFMFHHKKLSPYEVVSFEDEGKMWGMMLSKGFRIRLDKEVIVRIEPIHDPKDFRTWYDRDGKHSIIASYETYEPPNVKYTDLAGHSGSIDAKLLSEYDQKHLYYKILHPELLPK